MKSVHVFILALLIWLPQLFTWPPTRQQELRVLITGRNMVRSGQYFEPEFQNQPRYRKPPAAYWLAALGFKLTGQEQAARAGRLFFLLNALLGLFLLQKICGDAGITASLIALFSYGFIRFAPLAETDFIQLTGILLAVYAWQRNSGTLAGLGAGFAALSKGPGGFVIPVLLFLILQPSVKKKASFWLSLLGVSALLAGGWIIYLTRIPGAFDALLADVNDTFIDSVNRNPRMYYFYTFPLLMLPSGFLLIRCSLRKVKTLHRSHLTALVWFLLSFVLLTLTMSKQRHYALMLLPPAAWMLAGCLPPLRLNKKHIAALYTLAAGIALAGNFHVRLTPEWNDRQFLQAVARNLPADVTPHVVGMNSAIFDFHLGRHVENTDNPRVALARLRPGNAAVIVLKHRLKVDWEIKPDLDGSDSLTLRHYFLNEQVSATQPVDSENKPDDQ